MEKYFPLIIILCGVVGVVGRKRMWIAIPALIGGFTMAIWAAIEQFG
jgi:hypothetical protein